MMYTQSQILRKCDRKVWRMKKRPIETFMKREYENLYLFVCLVIFGCTCTTTYLQEIWNEDEKNLKSWV